jgi:hypothetical protein
MMDTRAHSIVRGLLRLTVLGASCIAIGGCAGLAGYAAAQVAMSVALLGHAAMRTRMVDAEGLSAEEFRQLEHVRWVTAAEGRAYTSKGKIVGLACLRTLGWRPAPSDRNGASPEEIARTQLRIAAMRNGANAVLSPSCTHKDGGDWVNDCSDSWVCVAEAVSLD